MKRINSPRLPRLNAFALRSRPLFRHCPPDPPSNRLHPFCRRGAGHPRPAHLPPLHPLLHTHGPAAPRACRSAKAKLRSCTTEITHRSLPPATVRSIQTVAFGTPDPDDWPVHPAGAPVAPGPLPAPEKARWSSPPDSVCTLRPRRFHNPTASKARRTASCPCGSRERKKPRVCAYRPMLTNSSTVNA